MIVLWIRVGFILIFGRFRLVKGLLFFEVVVVVGRFCDYVGFVSWWCSYGYVGFD